MGRDRGAPEGGGGGDMGRLLVAGAAAAGRRRALIEEYRGCVLDGERGGCVLDTADAAERLKTRKATRTRRA